MKMNHVLAALLVTAFALPASAAVFDFANLKYNGGVNSGFLPNETKNVGYWGCTGGDICSSNLGAGQLGGDLKYFASGVEVTATGYYLNNGVWGQVSVVQDHENGYNPTTQIGAGLGVYHKTNDNSDDNVTVSEKLVLKFSQNVQLDGLSMRSDGHDTSWTRNATFLLNGITLKLTGAISQPTLAATNGLQLIGNEFTFQFQNNTGKVADQFYLGGLTVSIPVPGSSVPEPGNLALMFAGLCGLAYSARRRQA